MKDLSHLEQLVWSRVYATEFARLEHITRENDAHATGTREEPFKLRRERLQGVALNAMSRANDAVVSLREARERRGS